MVRIGAKQMSVPSMILHQSSRVLLLNTCVNFFPQRGPRLAVHLCVEIGIGKPGMLAQQRIECGSIEPIEMKWPQEH